MKGDFHVRFRENAGVKFPCVTRLAAIGAEHFASEKRQSIVDNYGETRKNE